MKWQFNKTEREIMSYFWKNGQWTSGAEIWAYFNSLGKIISRQAVNSYLARMVDKGFLIKHGKKFMYAYTESEFEKKRTQEITDTLYGGSTKKLISAGLTGGKQLTKEETQELIDLLNNMQRS